MRLMNAAIADCAVTVSVSKDSSFSRSDVRMRPQPWHKLTENLCEAGNMLETRYNQESQVVVLFIYSVSCLSFQQSPSAPTRALPRLLEMLSYFLYHPSVVNAESRKVIGAR